MAHAVHSRNFGRNSSWRKATVRSLAQALLTRERIRTTHAKAKEAQRFTERLITLGKDGTLAARRRAISLLADPAVVKRLFAEIAPRFEKRAGGYTRILHDSFRPGDGASMSVIELVELSPDLVLGKDKPKGKEKAAEKKGEARKEKGRAKPAAAEPEPKKSAPAAAVQTPSVAEPAPKKEPAQETKPQPAKEKKPASLVDGLRKFLKGRDKRS